RILLQPFLAVSCLYALAPVWPCIFALNVFSDGWIMPARCVSKQLLVVLSQGDNS
ncbi:unnamed protein product, partial [Staurois parvus]